MPHPSIDDQSGDVARYLPQAFWSFNLGHLLIILGMLGAAIWWFVTYDRDFYATKIAVSQIVKSVDKLADKVEQIDAQGTRFSQKGLERDMDFVKTSNERLSKLETLGPKVDMMGYQLTQITAWVEEQKRIQADSDYKHPPRATSTPHL